MTVIGASANVVVLGIAARDGTPISFWELTRKGIIVTVITIALAAPEDRKSTLCRDGSYG